MGSVLLDTSALLTLRDNEAGAERVVQLLEASAAAAVPSAVACFMSRMEVLYRVWKDEGERAGRLAHEQLLALPIRWVEASDALLQQAASLKACYPLSVADAWIAAAAQLEGACLVHKDPEFRAIEALSQEWLA
ncbi:MAG: type II toxin-antitoxin system VapC family toxin [Cyanobacteria bacterium K_Offshore_0m_m2_072]|nr:type II toxin-antitoxin system VapC family toxin [Cyanobacteria bacterium K_Offshore_0m_m2_072]